MMIKDVQKVLQHADDESTRALSKKNLVSNKRKKKKKIGKVGRFFFSVPL
jgi:hypothetical protein